MGKVDENKRLKMNSLLDTAFHLFTTKGLLKTSISDIVEQAGVAKGTFYLYFKDKYDIRNYLVEHKSSQLFLSAVEAAEKREFDSFSDKLIFIVDHIIDQLAQNPKLLNFISKNLSWGIFKYAFVNPSDTRDVNFKSVYRHMIQDENIHLRKPEIMLFLIVELVSSTCYSAILFGEPTDLQALKPHLYDTIRDIVVRHTDR